MIICSPKPAAIEWELTHSRSSIRRSSKRSRSELVHDLTVVARNAADFAVKVVPIHAELTAQEAADMLNVSRPHLVKLLESGALPFHKAGKHRRVRFADLMAFKAERDRASSQAMEELARQDQELRLGYE